MSLREQLTADMKEAMKAGEKRRLATIRLMQAAIKNRDIEARTGKAPADDNTLVVEVLQKSMATRNIPFSAQNRMLALLAPMHRDIINVK